MKFIRLTFVETRRELNWFLFSPTGYLFFVIFLVVINLLGFTYGKFFEVGEATLAASFFPWHSLLYAILVPSLGMRLWSEENRQGTHELLFSHPVPLSALVLGKYLSLVIATSVALFCTFPLVISVNLLGDLDFGQVWSCYLGSAGIIVAFAAITCLGSALVQSQVAAFILSAVSCFTLVLISSQRIVNEVVQIFPEQREIVDLIASLGINPYFQNFLRGIVDLRSISYFLLLAAIALTINWLVLKRRQITA